MLSMDFIRTNRATVERAITVKGVDLDLDARLEVLATVRQHDDVETAATAGAAVGFGVLRRARSQSSDDSV
jgi:hypothetical protein